MTARNIAAFTPPVPQPGFVSINRQDDGAVTISVRDAASPEGVLGEVTCLRLTDAEWADLRQQIINHG